MRILAAPLLIGLASEVLAENHKDNKSPIVWNDYIVCKGYEDTVVYDDDQTNFDTEKLTIPKILNFMKQFSGSSNGMPKRKYDAFINVFFKKNDNDIIILKFDDWDEDDQYHFKISDAKTYYHWGVENAIARLTFDEVNKVKRPIPL